MRSSSAIFCGATRIDPLHIRCLGSSGASPPGRVNATPTAETAITPCNATGLRPVHFSAGQIDRLERSLKWLRLGRCLQKEGVAENLRRPVISIGACPDRRICLIPARDRLRSRILVVLAAPCRPP